MTMNTTRLISLLLQLGTCLGLSAAPPGIVLIMADDFGYECVGANGGTSYKTPVLDEMAAQGMRFEHCYSQPICTPSRVKLMTGMGNFRNYVKFGLLDPGQSTFAQVLKRAGYATCVVGKWQLLGGYEGPNKFGFDEYALWQLNRRPSRYPNGGLEINGRQVNFTNGEYLPDIVSDYACHFIEKNKAQPFLLYYPMILTHCPFEPTPDSKHWNPKSPGSKTYKGNPKYFGDMVAYMDKLIGKILSKLDEVGVRENTLVIFLADNGTDAPILSTLNGRKVAGAKGEMHDGGTRVPFIASWPVALPRGKVSKEIIDFSDFLPTFCEMAGVPTPEGIDGRSLLQTLKGSDEKHRRWIYMWYSRNGKNKEARQFARTQRYKLYGDGKFFDVQEDVREMNPLPTATLNEEQRAIHAMLQRAIDQHTNQRPSHLGRAPKAKRAKKAKKQGG